VFRFQISRFSLLTPDTKKYEQKNLSVGAGVVKKSVNYFMAKMKDDEIAVECSVLDVCFFIRCWNNLRSGATSLFDVRRSMFDVRRSSFNMFDVHLSKHPRTA